MSKSAKKMNKFLGTRLFKRLEDDSFDIIRIIRILEFNDKVLIKNEDTGKTKKVTIDSLKGYTPLNAFGVVSFSNVKIYDPAGGPDMSDVIVCLYNMLDIKMDQNIPPYAVCRQNITDVFYNLIADREDHGVVGLSISRDNCPTNFDYRIMASCDEITDYDMVNMYIDDTVEDILECIDIEKYDKILYDNYSIHMKAKYPMWNKKIDEMKVSAKGDGNLSDSGWCRNLYTLLNDNNFSTDMDTLRNITALGFDLSEDIISEKVDEEYTKTYLTTDCMKYLSYVFKVNMKSTLVIKYGLDIDLADFNNSNYVLVRDINNDLYIVVYTTEGEYLEKELEDQANKMDFSTKYRLAFYNKYN